MNEVNEFVGTTPLLAHNAAFDQKFWDFELGGSNAPVCRTSPVRCCWPAA
jgi:DNA polymerase III epsilon subunit-like protein